MIQEINCLDPETPPTEDLDGLLTLQINQVVDSSFRVLLPWENLHFCSPIPFQETTSAVKVVGPSGTVAEPPPLNDGNVESTFHLPTEGFECSTPAMRIFECSPSSPHSSFNIHLLASERARVKRIFLLQHGNDQGLGDPDPFYGNLVEDLSDIHFDVVYSSTHISGQRIGKLLEDRGFILEYTCGLNNTG